MRLDTAPEESRRIEREGCVRGNVGSERTHGGRRPRRSRDRRTRETVTLGLCGGFVSRGHQTESHRKAPSPRAHCLDEPATQARAKPGGRGAARAHAGRRGLRGHRASRRQPGRGTRVRLTHPPGARAPPPPHLSSASSLHSPPTTPHHASRLKEPTARRR